MIADSPYLQRHTMPTSGPDRYVGSLSELSDADVLRRLATSLRKEARNAFADRVDRIAERLDALTRAIKES